MDALTAWMRGPQTLAGRLLRVLAPRVALFATLATAVLVGQAVSATPASLRIDSAPALSPTWTLAEQAAQPDCVPLDRWPEGRPAAEVVVSRASDGEVVRIGFDRAWTLNHNGSASDDLWVLGVCG